MVSVFMITYNHEKYIEKAIKSVLMQKTNFSWELIIGEDFSTDGTRGICKKYQKKYHGKVKLLESKQNLGAKQNALRTLRNCSGKYIAYLEGDDYWTDKKKLQIQVDFLENNPDYSLCCHRVKILDMDTKEVYLFSDRNVKGDSTVHDLCNSNFISANSVLFRNYPKVRDLTINSEIMDWVLWVYIAQYGKIKYIKKAMAVYRRHKGGIFSSQDDVTRYKMEIEAAETWRGLIKPGMCDKEYREFIGWCNFEILKIMLNNKANEEDISGQLKKVGDLIPDNPKLLTSLENTLRYGSLARKQSFKIRGKNIIKKTIQPLRKARRKKDFKKNEKEHK